MKSHIILSMNKYIFAYLDKNEGNPHNYLDVTNATINCIYSTTLSAAMPNGRNDYTLIITYGGQVMLTEKNGNKYLDSHCIIYKPFQPHNYTYIASPDSEIYCLHFKGVFAQSILEELHLTDNYYFRIEKTPAISQIVKQLILSLRSRESNFQTKCNCELLKLFIILSESSKNNTENYPNIKNSRIQHAVNAILNDPSEFKKVSQLAALCNMPESTFTKTFTKTVGRSPMEYLNEKKLEHSIFFLLESDYTIGEISDRLGYDNQFYFCNRFKKLYKMSPSQYRREFKQLHYLTDEETKKKIQENQQNGFIK